MNGEDVKDILKHYGVLGMRWGIRNDRRSTGSGSRGKGSNFRASTKKQTSADHAKAANVKGKKAKHLSDDELKTALARIRLEREYKSLTKREISSGEKWVAGLLLGSAGTIASGLIVKGMTPIVAKYIAKAVTKYAEYKITKKG